LIEVKYELNEDEIPGYDAAVDEFDHPPGPYPPEEPLEPGPEFGFPDPPELPEPPC